MQPQVSTGMTNYFLPCSEYSFTVVFRLRVITAETIPQIAFLCREGGEVLFYMRSSDNRRFWAWYPNHFYLVETTYSNSAGAKSLCPPTNNWRRILLSPNALPLKRGAHLYIIINKSTRSYSLVIHPLFIQSDLIQQILFTLSFAHVMSGEINT